MNRTVNGGGASGLATTGLEAKAKGSPKGRDPASGETRRRTLAAPEFDAASAVKRPEATGWLRRAALIVVDRTAPERLRPDGSGPMSSALGLHQRAFTGRGHRRCNSTDRPADQDMALVRSSSDLSCPSNIARLDFDGRFPTRATSPKKSRARPHPLAEIVPFPIEERAA
jgi:hypothetical protein